MYHSRQGYRTCRLEKRFTLTGCIARHSTWCACNSVIISFFRSFLHQCVRMVYVCMWSRLDCLEPSCFSRFEGKGFFYFSCLVCAVKSVALFTAVAREKKGGEGAICLKGKGGRRSV